MPTCRQGAGLPFGRGHSRGRGGGRRPAAAAPRRHCAALAAVGNTHKRALSSEEEEDTWPSTSGEQQPPRVLPPPPSLRGRLPRKHWNALALAYLGDSVWEVRWQPPADCWLTPSFPGPRSRLLQRVPPVATSPPAPLRLPLGSHPKSWLPRFHCRCMCAGTISPRPRPWLPTTPASRPV